MNEPGDLITLEDQDRSLWDQGEIAEGAALLDPAARRGQPGMYLLHAQIARCHATTSTAADTSWALIADLDGDLGKLVPSAMVELNRAVTIAMADGPAAGLRLVQALTKSKALAGHSLLPATQADLLRRLDRHDEATASYRRALDLTGNEAERRYLAHRLAAMDL